MKSLTGGQEGIDYLSRERQYANEIEYPFPSVVLLDLNMPGLNGFDVLKWKGRQPRLNPLPVVVWSSSQLPEDEEQAIALGATDYVVKPMNLEGLLTVFKNLADSFPKNT